MPASVSGNFNFDGLGKQVVEAWKKDAQKVLDQVHKTHSGKPEAQVTSELQRKFRSAKLDGTGNLVKTAAKVIAGGDRVVLTS